MRITISLFTLLPLVFSIVSAVPVEPITNNAPRAEDPAEQRIIPAPPIPHIPGPGSRRVARQDNVQAIVPLQNPSHHIPGEGTRRVRRQEQRIIPTPPPGEQGIGPTPPGLSGPPILP